MSSGVTHFSSEDLEHLSNSFQTMGREYKLSNGSNNNGFMHNSGHVWEDNNDDLKEDDVWGGHDTSADWNFYNRDSDGEYNDAMDNGVATKGGKNWKSGLTMELQAAGMKGHKKEYLGVGFAALEAVHGGGLGGGRESNGGWAPGFSVRKVKIPFVGDGAGGSGYANGWHGTGLKTKRGGMPQSAPVSMPVWPAKCGYGDSNGDVDADDSSPEDGGDNDQDDEDDADDEGERRGRLAPHEIIDREYARSRSTTFSVIEGAGRTLKGSDLRRVRNAVWSVTGFED
ncbi:hypothetical protein GOP47_0005714 [Adiantum capillus-veneris]|uniref:Uncharacterized protein n=1 Tax=Adiantum capillus-veneris TaxID=13818 RepID=A0A9D4V5L0_ADICA|nr:hypothetical protein GOP47_0005714 [Adiantum capillus-veneris]